MVMEPPAAKPLKVTVVFSLMAAVPSTVVKLGLMSEVEPLTSKFVTFALGVELVKTVEVAPLAGVALLKPTNLPVKVPSVVGVAEVVAPSAKPPKIVASAVSEVGAEAVKVKPPTVTL